MFPRDVPLLVRIAALFYLGHLLFQGKIATSELGAFWAIFFLGWALAKKQATLSWSILYYPLALYGVVSTVSSLAAVRQIHGWGEAMLWFKMLIFPASLTLMTVVPRLRDYVVRAYMIFGTYIAAWGLYEYFILDYQDLEHRITGPSTHVMTYSGLLLPISLLLIVLWIHRRHWTYLAAGLVVTTALLLTFTRSVWLGWLVAMAVLLLLTRPKWLMLAAPLLLLFITFMPEPLFARLISTFDITQSSNLDRLRMLEAGGEIIRDSPLLGVGPANVKEIYPLYKKHDAPRFRPPHLHNNVVQLWAERGVLALVAYLLLLGLFLRECWRAWRGPARMWAEVGVVVTVALAYAGLFEFNFGDTEVFYILMEMYALVVASIALDAPQPLSAPALVLNEPLPALVPGGA